MGKTSVKFTLTEGNTQKAIGAKTAVKELLRAILIYAALFYVPAAIIIVVLALIFKFNVFIPLLIAIPSALLVGVLILVLSAKINSQPDRFSECSKDFAENGFYSEENLNWLLSEYERTSKNNETGLRNITIIFLAYHYRSNFVQQPQTAAEYLSEYYFDNSKPLTTSKKYLRLNYYVSSLLTYIHLDDNEVVENVYREAFPLFEELSKEDVCRSIIRGALFDYFLYKKDYCKAEELLTEEPSSAAADSMRTNLLAEQGRYDEARQICKEILHNDLSKLEKKLVSEQLQVIDLLEQGVLQRVFDYLPNQV